MKCLRSNQKEQESEIKWRNPTELIQASSKNARIKTSGKILEGERSEKGIEEHRKSGTREMKNYQIKQQ